jgi:protein TonB
MAATMDENGQQQYGFSGAFDSKPDNLPTMLFVAALFHSVLILGVSFTAGESARSSSDSTSVDVVLLTRDYEKRPESADAEYLAQQNLVGSGNTTDDDELRVAYGRNAHPVMPGMERDGAEQESRKSRGQQSSEELLYARNPNAAATSEGGQQRTEVQLPMRTGMPGTANTIEILAAPDIETVLKGAKPRQLLISANTRESRIAAYLDSWKRRVERVGTINFPRSVLSQPTSRNPVLQVGIASSGKLVEVIVITGSGNRELDMAAVDILRRASPFDPFPEYLRNDYDSLKFSYEWRFSRSSVGRMKVP